jgi:D-amino-acid dehydrogenase
MLGRWGCVFTLLLHVYRTREAWDHYEATNGLLQRHFGVSARRYDRAALQQLEPALKEGLAGGWHYQCDAHLRPDILLTDWRTFGLPPGTICWG